jgi:hypothetical protein
VKDKLYFSDINALNIRFRDIDNFIERFCGIVEKTPVTKGEKSRHSTEKLIHNSKYLLLSIMRALTSDEIIHTINYIVSRYVNDSARKRLYVEVVLFDTLNQIFGYSKGSGELIFEIYKSLEHHLNHDMDYWLQRAKSIYRIRPNCLDDLLNAYQYSKKSLGDGNERIRSKSALTTSLICCLVSKLVIDPQEQYDFEVEAIKCAEIAIASEYFSFNRGNLRIELGRKSYAQLIKGVCNKHLTSMDDYETAWKSTKILKELQEISLLY